MDFFTQKNIKMSVTRRDFVKTLAVGGAVALSGVPLWLNAEGSEKLTILHTNDTHSRLDPFPPTDHRYPSMGGYARRATIIERVRQQENHLLVLDAGDIFQGTPYFNFFGGQPEVELMSKMGYDASTMGNHEFDNGLEGFLNVLNYTKFPFIVSNYDFSDTILRDHEKIITHKIFYKGNIKIGVYGLGIEPEGLVSKNLYGNTKYLNPISSAIKMENLLKEEFNCDLIVCLSHLGYFHETGKVSDVVIAENTRHTDLILGGHTHTILEKPDQKLNLEKRTVHIGQTGIHGIRIGRIDVWFDKKNDEKFVESYTIKV